MTRRRTEEQRIKSASSMGNVDPEMAIMDAAHRFRQTTWRVPYAVWVHEPLLFEGEEVTHIVDMLVRVEPSVPPGRVYVFDREGHDGAIMALAAYKERML
jgi:hypothetical protein